MNRTISIRNDHPRLRVPRAGVRRAIRLLDRHAAGFLGGGPPGELSLAFLTDPALARIHAEFMHDPTPTDVITFAGGDAHAGAGQPAGAGRLAGEICVSVDAAARHAVPHGARRPRGLEPFAEELTLYLVHGWLHLAGYDDRQPANRRRMRRAERRALAMLRGARAIPAFRLT